MQSQVPSSLSYRVALTHAGSLALLLPRSLAPARRLPRTLVSMADRPTRQLQISLEQRWAIRATVVDYLPYDAHRDPCAVMEAHTGKLPNALQAVEVSEVTDTDLSPQERIGLSGLLAGEAVSPIARPGWLRAATHWVQQVTGKKVKARSDIEQWNAGGPFALLRIPVEDGDSYWLKATGEPNRHEQSIHSLLATLCPKHIPEVVAVQPEWNAWLTRHEGVAAVQHGSSIPPYILCDAASALAHIQRQSIGHEEAVLAAGAFDQRLHVLSSHSELLFDRIEEAMQLQTSIKVPRLDSKRLRKLRGHFEAICDFLKRLSFPATVLHGDLNAGNLLQSDRHCNLIDWCEAYVGHPLVALQHLLLLNRSLGGSRDLASQRSLIRTYQVALGNVCKPEAFEGALRCMPFLAAASAVYGRGDWLRCGLPAEPDRQARIRTLARSMDRAAQDTDFLQVISGGRVACAR